MGGGNFCPLNVALCCCMSLFIVSEYYNFVCKFTKSFRFRMKNEEKKSFYPAYTLASLLEHSTPHTAINSWPISLIVSRINVTLASLAFFLPLMYCAIRL